jgi:hypothetical protein
MTSHLLRTATAVLVLFATALPASARDRTIAEQIKTISVERLDEAHFRIVVEALVPTGSHSPAILPIEGEDETTTFDITAQLPTRARPGVERIRAERTVRLPEGSEITVSARRNGETVVLN